MIIMSCIWFMKCYKHFKYLCSFISLTCKRARLTPRSLSLVQKLFHWTQKARTKKAHAKCFVLDHPVSRPGKNCTHAQTCQRNARRRSKLWLTQPIEYSNRYSNTGACVPSVAAGVAGATAAPEATHWAWQHKHTRQRRQGTRWMWGNALLRAMRAACKLTPAWHPLSRAQPAPQRSGWDARARGPVMALRVAKAHANKIRANGHCTPSSENSTRNAPGRGPSLTRSHFHYTCLSPLQWQSSVLVTVKLTFWPGQVRDNPVLIEIGGTSNPHKERRKTDSESNGTQNLWGYPLGSGLSLLGLGKWLVF